MDVVNGFRRGSLAVAEFLDSWRIIPRALVGGYAYVMYDVVQWYMALKPTMIEGCVSANVIDCIIPGPTTQHAALVTAVVSIAAAIFGLYANSGRDWKGPFRSWEKPSEPEKTNSDDSV